ncbi:MAG TPA: M48 family metalloprotease [Puia sp.]|nr:M48 family metalloprotease [Puia sp.]
MGNARWLGVCRWVHILLVVGYVFVTIMIVIVLLVVFGVRMANWVRWMMIVGWFGVCFGGVVLVEWLGLSPGKGCRRPISSEEERLSKLLKEVWRRIGSEGKREMQFLILSASDRRDGSLGLRTIMISSGTLILASDEELRGILAHELGHLRDGDRILEAASLASGMLALGFRLGCRLIRRGFRLNWTAGLLLLALLSPVLLSLWFFFCVDLVFRGLEWVLVKLGDVRQDCFAARSGCGKGLRDWLEKSGLAVNVSRIRRLEKMV